MIFARQIAKDMIPSHIASIHSIICGYQVPNSHALLFQLFGGKLLIS